MKTLGIIGGIAPPSTSDYSRQLTARYCDLGPDGGDPSIVIDSIDAQAVFALLEAGDRAGMIEGLRIESGRLNRPAADLALFASNTPMQRATAALSRSSCCCRTRDRAIGPARVADPAVYSRDREVLRSARQALMRCRSGSYMGRIEARAG